MIQDNIILEVMGAAATKKRFFTRNFKVICFILFQNLLLLMKQNLRI